ncbi:ATP-binding cassette subfamily C protein CydD [Arcanobacterium wilhelmae]|uniref:ATP-binding cassette subfamily C protein CydD n=1 Tax=Arcanobacterium wilhelmae TaxID=1803177 RepID=A0ABT9NDA7_9ACTO|nr:thiol reductant ABC exporter subunit CydD [Arcanobacterium wilhelmae]MDP9801632.1 ATP-binding cassette subfamily C protein CydD [Arcanobacterium wilhelmae]WFN90954.1 thiol reductant ABC exporter subunit CydD [Arcanobacterium wilhelmae]
MKPFDPRLIRYASATRAYIAFLVGLGLLSTASITAQVFLIAYAVEPIFYGNSPTTARLVLALAGVLLARAAVTYVQKSIGHRAALKVIADLRGQVLRHAGDMGERWLSDGHSPKIVTLATRGLDDLEDYFVKFLPELFLTAIAMPALLLVVAILDWPSALLVAACIPLVPLFMILIGKLTARYSAKRLKTMEEQSAQLLDLLAGLPTLKALGREKGPGAHVKTLGDRFASSTLQTLAVAFLSGAALEFLTTLTTALVAVEVGFRMVGGSILLAHGLILIMLTPEILRPLREVGTQFHASANGVAAVDAALTLLTTPLPTHDDGVTAPDLASTPIKFNGVSMFAEGRATVAPAGLTGVVEPGKVTVLRGPSGAGKTTAVSMLLGLLQPSEGTIRIGSIPLENIDRESLWNQITWVPQRPALIPGTVADNLGASPEEAAQAAALTGFSDVVASLPDGWDTRIGSGGVGLSVGQRQRLALTRALVSPRALVVLDEPSAHLDASSETYVSDVVKELRRRGHTVLVIAHRAAMVALADHVIDVRSGTRDISAELAADAARRRAIEAVNRVLDGEADFAIPAALRNGGTR